MLFPSFITGLVLLLSSTIAHSSASSADHFHLHKRHLIPPQQSHGPQSATRFHQERNRPRNAPLESVTTVTVVSNMTVVASVTATITVPPPGYSPSTSSSTSSSAFNPRATDNVVVYFGQTPATNEVPLSTICNDTNVNIIVLGFVTVFFTPNNTAFPSVNFASNDGPINSAMLAAGAVGLNEANGLAAQISNCQDAGKIVLLSLGGWASRNTTVFANDTQAEHLAGTLWDLFGNGTGLDPQLRPFGSVVLDGFDLDNESSNPTGYAAFTSSLRALYASDPSKAYYISAAPQCPRPDASIPLGAMWRSDFVWVQFYNNPECNLDNSTAFPQYFQDWSDDLNNGTQPSFFVGTLAMNGTGDTGYVSIETLQGQIGMIKGLNLPNFGGVMMWDGSEAVLNGNYRDGVKSALLSAG